jgi:hypothetical protein
MLPVMKKLSYRKLFSIFVLSMAAAGLYACSGGAAIGEACSTENDTGECASGALCTKAESGALTCLKICTQQSECGDTENCTGTTGSETKVCQDTTGSGGATGGGGGK